jgi:septal ring factor EnvC (AmiA/AmiB activator)
MNRSFIKQAFLLLFLFGGILLNVSAQSKSSLQNKKKKLQEEIQYTNKLLEETEKTKKSSLSQLQQLNKKISSRQILIQTIEQEINLLNDSIKIQIANVDSLELNLTDLKAEYAEMVRKAYRNRSDYNKLMFLFSANNFNQAYKRLNYFQQYARFRQEQAERIKKEQIKIDKQIKLLEAIRKSNEGLLKAELNEKNVLASEKSKKENVVSSLKGKEKELKAQLDKKRKDQKKVNAAIERIIAEEIRKAREAAAKKGKSEKGFPMTPEARELSNSFTANKGKLPWPVSEGVIVSKFGNNAHPTLSNVTVENYGVDISTRKGNIGRASFEGTVSNVIIIPGQGKVVLVNHGEYFTLYSYFKEVFVSSGDKLTTKQDIGVLMNESGENTSTMHFEIWKALQSGKASKLDPASWIYKN